MHSLKSIAQAIPMPWHSFDARSGAHMLRAPHELIDPFLGIDSYTMPQPFFPPHPHAGMSAVSLMLPEAEAGFINRDSLGDHSVIRPGDLHWTQAGRGMMHEEVPEVNGKAARGLQIFVNMSRVNKQAAPAALKVKREDTPVIAFEGGQVRVVTGEFSGYSSPIAQDPRWLTRVNLLDITVKPGMSVDVPVVVGDNSFFVMRTGSLRAGDATLREPHGVFFSRTGQVARIEAGDTELRGVFLSGTPLNEPVFSGGPFTGNSAEDITAYRRAFTRGEMGNLQPSF
jgi:redox-sensitive bicupin YhaK (pirin superfamily)